MTPRRRWALALGLAALGLVALALAALVVPYRPRERAGAVARPGPYRLPAPLSGMKLHVFNTGQNRMAHVLVGDQRPWRPAPAFVIEHPREGLVVFDCGLSPEVAARGEAALPAPVRWLFESRGRPDRTLDVQMREAHLDPSAVRLVVVSHLHDDHVGAARTFAGATFLGGPGTAGHPVEGFVPRWRELDFVADRPPPADLASVRGGSPVAIDLPFDAGVDVLGDGSLLLLPGGGHAREDVMALLALPGGRVLLAGDAVVHRDWLASDDVQRIATSPERAADVRNQVRAFVRGEPSVVLVPGHDLGGLPHDRADVVLHHPEGFGVEGWPIERR